MIKGNSNLIKKINVYNIIKLLKNSPGLSRAEIAKKTKLTPASITKITKQLLDKGVLIESGAGENSLGRPSILLNINKEAGYFIGFYLAPRKIISIFTNYVGETVSTLETKLMDLSHENILDIIDIHIESFKRINSNITTPCLLKRNHIIMSSRSDHPYIHIQKRGFPFKLLPKKEIKN